MEAEMLAGLTQFGTAGLIGWLWLSERRAAVAREREAAELVERIRAERAQLDALVTLVRESTRVLALVEAGQQRLCAAVERLDAWVQRTRSERATGQSVGGVTDGRAGGEAGGGYGGNDASARMGQGSGGRSACGRGDPTPTP